MTDFDDSLSRFRQTSFSKASERAVGGTRQGKILRGMTVYFDEEMIGTLKSRAALNANSLSAQIREDVLRCSWRDKG